MRASTLAINMRVKLQTAAAMELDSDVAYNGLTVQATTGPSIRPNMHGLIRSQPKRGEWLVQ